MNVTVTYTIEGDVEEVAKVDVLKPFVTDFLKEAAESANEGNDEDDLYFWRVNNSWRHYAEPGGNHIGPYRYKVTEETWSHK